MWLHEEYRLSELVGVAGALRVYVRHFRRLLLMASSRLAYIIERRRDFKVTSGFGGEEVRQS